ncbi:ArsR/SmtB family transcription factor [Arthrobacter sp. L77]|uniref:ArsR/SmtB family transcription factor n=1 Tax=Arthrobacter sp. L77 TaxID=1496689 RepID=UPI0005BBD11C|nr:metalloregulator ArsR/SmtB family transcription factor [Arthrobacter sp. L77]
MGIDDVFAVIAEGTRRQILEKLRDGDKAVGELVIELQVSQPTVSKHLKVLREAGLVSMRAQGQKRYYSLDTAPLGLVRDWLAGFEPSAGPVSAATSGGERPEGESSEVMTVADVVAVLEPETTAAPVTEDTTALAAAVLVAPPASGGPDAPRPPMGRTMGRAAERAADLLSQLRRRRDPSS